MNKENSSSGKGLLSREIQTNSLFQKKNSLCSCCRLCDINAVYRFVEQGLRLKNYFILPILPAVRRILSILLVESLDGDFREKIYLCALKWTALPLIYVWRVILFVSGTTNTEHPMAGGFGPFGLNVFTLVLFDKEGVAALRKF
ncbi:MAG: hypothetical protein S4CHLAM123_15310 [Chlamydiales bacterium]|nr:hypothetical protein [Chlamydiales bacterium]